MSPDWISYDSSARTHDRLGVPAMFAGPAKDLAARLDPAHAGATLDVGAGSGVVASAMAACPVVIAADPSLEMLRLARGNGVAAVVAAGLPHLPFPDARFDRVTAGFVLSHVPSYEAALQDMLRVLRPGGKLGVTSWSKLDNQFVDYWDGLVDEVIDRDALRAAMAQWVPWEDWLADRGRLREALVAAGLHEVAVEEIEYPIHMTSADFLAIREASGTSRFLRTVMNADEFDAFCARAREKFVARFRHPLDFSRRALIGIGTR